VPFAVVTPVTLPTSMFTARTSVFDNTAAPRAAAARAKPMATCDGSKYLSSPILIATTTRVGTDLGRKIGNYVVQHAIQPLTTIETR
jgi:hypothetical protein